MFDALIRRGRAGAATLAAVAALAPVAAGCAAGADAQTNRPYSATEGTDAAVSSIKLRDNLIVGPQPGAKLNPGDHAPLYLTLVNDGTAADRLENVTTDGTFGARKITGGQIDVAPGQAVRIGQNPAIIFGKLSKSLAGGESVRVTFTFTHAGTVTVTVPVVTRDRYFATYAPAPSATPTQKPNAKNKKAKPGAPAGPNKTASKARAGN